MIQNRIKHIYDNNISSDVSQHLIDDDYNPNLLFNLTSTELLIAITNGTIDVVKLAKQQLELRSVGFVID